MDTVTDWLERVRAKIAAERGVEVDQVKDYAVAKRLGITQNRISRYRLHGGKMDNLAALKVAEVLGVERLSVVASVEAERARNPVERAWWLSVAEQFGRAAVLVAVAGAGVALPSPSEAAAERATSPAVCIMSNPRRRPRRGGVFPLVAMLESLIPRPRFA